MDDDDFIHSLIEARGVLGRGGRRRPHPSPEDVRRGVRARSLQPHGLRGAEVPQFSAQPGEYTDP